VIPQQLHPPTLGAGTGFATSVIGAPGSARGSSRNCAIFGQNRQIGGWLIHMIHMIIGRQCGSGR